MVTETSLLPSPHLRVRGWKKTLRGWVSFDQEKSSRGPSGASHEDRSCLNIRTRSQGGNAAWEFEKGRELISKSRRQQRQVGGHRWDVRHPSESRHGKQQGPWEHGATRKPTSALTCSSRGDLKEECAPHGLRATGQRNRRGKGTLGGPPAWRREATELNKGLGAPWPPNSLRSHREEIITEKKA